MAVSQSVTVFIISIILLAFESTNLRACPLPPSASCAQCEVLNYIDNILNDRSNISLRITLNLAKSINGPIEFAESINYRNDSINHRNDDFLFRVTGARNCSSYDNSTNGNPCTQSINMTGSHLPDCSWNYTCDYSPNRFPQYIWKAKCGPQPAGYRIQEVYYQLPTLTLESEVEAGCLPFQGANTVYRWGLERIPVACTCVPNQ